MEKTYARANGDVCEVIKFDVDRGTPIVFLKRETDGQVLVRSVDNVEIVTKEQIRLEELRKDIQEMFIAGLDFIQMLELKDASWSQEACDKRQAFEKAYEIAMEKTDVV